MKISLEQAIFLLKNDEVVGIPTETVYGLGASLASSNAIQKIYEIKQRPSANPLIIHVKDAPESQKFAKELPPDFFLLAEAFWPGPLTIILPILEETIPKEPRASLPTAAFRVPRHALMQKILEQVPAIVAPSANISGKPSSTKPEHIEHDFGHNFPVLDGGQTDHGLESTILFFYEGAWTLTRKGVISQDEIKQVLGYVPQIISKKQTLICPGQLFRHYSPKTRLILSQRNPFDPKQFAYVVGFSDRVYVGAKQLFSLGPSTDPCLVAYALYDVLRSLDLCEIEEAWVDVEFPHDGIWNTILERLTRASIS